MSALDPFLIGLTRDQVRAKLGEPDAVGGGGRRRREPTIWLYGSVEVCFSRGGFVDLVFDDPEKGGTGRSILQRDEPGPNQSPPG